MRIKSKSAALSSTGSLPCRAKHPAIEKLEDRRLFSGAGGGDPVATFGNGGTATVSPPGLASTTPSVLLPVGGTDEVVTVSSFNTPAGKLGVVLSRLTAAGAVDTAFGNNGYLFADVGNSRGIYLISAGQSSDGSITLLVNATSIFTGTKKGNLPAENVLIRYNADGSLDSHFGRKGEVVVPAARMQTINDMKVSNDGTVTVAGIYAYPQKLAVTLWIHRDVIFGSSPQAFEIVRYTPKGLADHSFNGTGALRERVGFVDAQPRLAVDTDGSIALIGNVGFSSREGTVDAAIVRLDSHGHPDTLFGSGGILIDGNTFGGNFIAFSPLGDGSLLVANDSGSQIQITNYMPTGQLNSNFGDRGIATLTSSSSITIGELLAMDVGTDGHITFLANATGVVPPGEQIAVQSFAAIVRCDEGGNLESTFGNAGVLNDPAYPPEGLAVGNNNIFVSQSNGEGFDPAYTVSAFSKPTYTLPLVIFN